MVLCPWLDITNEANELISKRENRDLAILLKQDEDTVNEFKIPILTATNTLVCTFNFDMLTIR